MDLVKDIKGVVLLSKIMKARLIILCTAWYKDKAVQGRFCTRYKKYMPSCAPLRIAPPGTAQVETIHIVGSGPYQISYEQTRLDR